jgi:hypothetical protein
VRHHIVDPLEQTSSVYLCGPSQPAARLSGNSSAGDMVGPSHLSMATSAAGDGGAAGRSAEDVSFSSNARKRPRDLSAADPSAGNASVSRVLTHVSGSSDNALAPPSSGPECHGQPTPIDVPLGANTSALQLFPLDADCFFGDDEILGMAGGARSGFDAASGAGPVSDFFDDDDPFEDVAMQQFLRSVATASSSTGAANSGGGGGLLGRQFSSVAVVSGSPIN